MFDFLSQKFSGVLGWLKDKGRLSEDNITEALSQVRDALLDADVPFALVEDFLVQVKGDVLGKKVQSSLNPGQHFIKIVHEKLLDFLKGDGPDTIGSFQIPSVIMVMGLQGSGKTTTIGKLSAFLKKEATRRNKQRKILCASIDFYRPAALDQLEVLAGKVDVDFYRSHKSDPVKAALDIYEYFKNKSYDYLFLDTAGRLHIDTDMMAELTSVAGKLKPRYKILVLDAMTGQESLRVAQGFNDEVGFDQAILTKMDSDARGGAAFSFRYSLRKPLSFVGSGEKIDDLESFVPDRMASRILGMGDILTLIEKTEDVVDERTQEEMSRKLLGGAFSLDDFRQQLDLVSNMGSLQKIAKYMPGAPQLSPDMIESGQKELVVFKAIMSSMTQKERLYPKVLDSSRRQRIARGSGTKVADINKLLERFEQSRQFAKMFKKSGMMKRLFK